MVTVPKIIKKEEVYPV